MRRLLISFSLVMALTLGVVLPAQARGHVPFFARVAIVDTGVDPANCALLHVPVVIKCFENAGTGTATYLDAFTSTGFVGLVSAVVSGSQARFTNIESLVFTAANGDTLELADSYTGIHDFTTNVVSILSAHWVVTGGTGRFRDATGNGTIIGRLQANMGPPETVGGTEILVGTISYGWRHCDRDGSTWTRECDTD